MEKTSKQIFTEILKEYDERVSIKELAEKYNIKLGTLQVRISRYKKRHWIKGKCTPDLVRTVNKEEFMQFLKDNWMLSELWKNYYLDLLLWKNTTNY